VTYALVAFGAGLLATALIHVLLLSTPSPFAFFGWIVGLCTLAAALAPFAAGGDLAPQVTTAFINAAIGIEIWALTASVARRSVQ
jgi:type IV secretory pathway TrbD component